MDSFEHFLKIFEHLDETLQLNLSMLGEMRPRVHQETKSSINSILSVNHQTSPSDTIASYLHSPEVVPPAAPLEGVF